MNYFKEIPQIKYEGTASKKNLAYRYYNPDEVILGKSMRAHLKFAVCYWHTMCGTGADPFGMGTMQRPWDEVNINDSVKKAKIRVGVFFELLEKLDLDYFCFHDRDIAPEGKNLQESNEILDDISSELASAMQKTGKKLLWGTANMFSHPRFVHGAGTSVNPEVFAYAAAQVKKAMEITKRLKGEGYVFWGGREGYETLLNTNMKLELENLAYLLKMAVEHAKKIDFTGGFYIEPKPREPSKHQYDFDVSTVISFLRQYNLERHFKLNIETNHATLAQHSMQHELRVAGDLGLIGSVDANQGDLLLGWDTDEFPSNVQEASLVMYEILRSGGLTSGGLNFDSKVRRASFQPDDLVYAHVLGVDNYAHGLRVAARLWEDRVFEKNLDQRYAAYNSGIGMKIRNKELSLESLEQYVLGHGSQESDIIAANNKSGRQELLLGILNRYISQNS